MINEVILKTLKTFSNLTNAGFWLILTPWLIRKSYSPGVPKSFRRRIDLFCLSTLKHIMLEFLLTYSAHYPWKGLVNFCSGNDIIFTYIVLKATLFIS